MQIRWPNFFQSHGMSVSCTSHVNWSSKWQAPHTNLATCMMLSRFLVTWVKMQLQNFIQNMMCSGYLGTLIGFNIALGWKSIRWQKAFSWSSTCQNVCAIYIFMIYFYVEKYIREKSRILHTISNGRDHIEHHHINVEIPLTTNEVFFCR